MREGADTGIFSFVSNLLEKNNKLSNHYQCSASSKFMQKNISEYTTQTLWVLCRNTLLSGAVKEHTGAAAAAAGFLWSSHAFNLELEISHNVAPMKTVSIHPSPPPHSFSHYGFLFFSSQSSILASLLPWVSCSIWQALRLKCLSFYSVWGWREKTSFGCDYFSSDWSLRYIGLTRKAMSAFRLCLQILASAILQNIRKSPTQPIVPVYPVYPEGLTSSGTSNECALDHTIPFYAYRQSTHVCAQVFIKERLNKSSITMQYNNLQFQNIDHCPTTVMEDQILSFSDASTCRDLLLPL